MTKAEEELDRRARKLMKQNPALGYAKACTEALEDDPGLYDQYQKEIASGATYLAAEPQYLSTQTD